MVNGQIDEAGELSDWIISTHDQINELDENEHRVPYHMSK